MYEELLGSAFQYKHDGSDRPLVDNLRLEVSDGSHQTSVTVNINILRVDKQAPYMLPTAICRVTVKEGKFNTKHMYCEIIRNIHS